MYYIIYNINVRAHEGDLKNSSPARLCRFHQAKRLKEPQGRKKMFSGVSAPQMKASYSLQS